MEGWSDGILLGILVDSRNPVAVVSFLLQFLDQFEEAIFNFVMNQIKFADSRGSNLPGSI